MNHSDPDLHCQDYCPNKLTIAGVLFHEHYLLERAVASGFYKRSPLKIDVASLLAAICAEAIKGSPSCNDLAASLEVSRPQGGPSRQAVHLRMNDSLHLFVHRLLADLIGGRASGAATRASSTEDSTHQFAGYQRVLVQDSTIIKLPPHLFEEFSGVSNAHSKVCNARLPHIACHLWAALAHRSDLQSVEDPHEVRQLAPRFQKPDVYPAQSQALSDHLLDQPAPPVPR